MDDKLVIGLGCIYLLVCAGTAFYATLRKWWFIRLSKFFGTILGFTCIVVAISVGQATEWTTASRVLFIASCILMVAMGYGKSSTKPKKSTGDYLD